MNELLAFWRSAPLDRQEVRLLDSVLRAHHSSVFRENPSTVCVANAALGSNELPQALAVALLTIGGKHAPVVQTVNFLAEEHPEALVPIMLKAGLKVPGWGGSWQAGEIDPLWSEVSVAIEEGWPWFALKLEAVTAALAEHGKILAPNPSAFTAVAALALRMPAPVAPWLFIAGRINGWAQVATQQLLKN